MISRKVVVIPFVEFMESLHVPGLTLDFDRDRILIARKSLKSAQCKKLGLSASSSPYRTFTVTRACRPSPSMTRISA